MLGENDIVFDGCNYKQFLPSTGPVQLNLDFPKTRDF